MAKSVTIGNVNIAMTASAAKLIQEANKAQSAFAKTMNRMTKDTESFTTKSLDMQKDYLNMVVSLNKETNKKLYANRSSELQKEYTEKAKAIQDEYAAKVKAVQEQYKAYADSATSEEARTRYMAKAAEKMKALAKEQMEVQKDLTRQSSLAHKELLKSLAANERQFEKRMKALRRSAKKTAGTLTGVFSSSMQTSAFALGAVAAALGTFTVAMYNGQRETQRMADIAGMSMQEFQKISLAAGAAGIDVETLADGMKDLSLRVTDAAQGGGALVDFFAAIGESAEDWANLDPVQQFEKFNEALDKLSPQEARFWADEVNDSMYRTRQALDRTGMTLKEFVDDANSLGAGTSGSLMFMTNEMYTSFHRLKTILGEIANTTLAALSPAFKKMFDDATTGIQGMLTEGDTTGEAIFNLSKNIAADIIGMFDKAILKIKEVAYSAVLLLSNFDESFLDNIDTTDSVFQALMLEKQIRQTQESIIDLKEAASTAGTHSQYYISGNLVEEQKKLAELIAQKEALGKSPLSTKLGEIATETRQLEYESVIKPAKGEDGKPKGNTEPSKGFKENLEMLAKAREILKEIELTQGMSKDSELQALEVKKAALKLYHDQLQAIGAQGDLSKEQADKNLAEMMRVDSAMAEIEKAASERRKKLAEEEAANKAMLKQRELDAERSFLQQQLQMAQEYNIGKRSAAELELELDLLRLDEFFALQNEKLDADYELGKIKKAEYELGKQEIVQQYADAEEQLHLKKSANEMSFAANSFGFMADQAKAAFGEQSAAAKAAFAISQGFAVGEALMNAQLAFSAAMADGEVPWYTRAANAALAMGSVMQAVGAIQSIKGQFHNGGEIPEDGTYYMQGGEMVIPRDKVTDFVNNAGNSEGKGGGDTIINSNINIGASLVDEKVMAAALSKQQSVLAALVQKEQKKRPTRR